MQRREDMTKRARSGESPGDKRAPDHKKLQAPRTRGPRAKRYLKSTRELPNWKIRVWTARRQPKEYKRGKGLFGGKEEWILISGSRPLQPRSNPRTEE